jgi:DNA topoisomerase-2
MYIGSLRPREQKKKWIYRDGTIVSDDLVYSDGLYRVFIEALSNAIDNVWRSRQAGVRVARIVVSADPDTGLTSIENDGLHIPVRIHETEEIYNPELIFGHLLSGSNLDDAEERLSSGRNGLGIKLTNVFSRRFSVCIADPENGKEYRQEWKNNMREMGEPVIRSYRKKTGSTRVEWVPDFEKFGMTGYDETILGLYRKSVHDAAMLTGVSMSWNDEKIAVRGLAEYAKLYYPGCEDMISIGTSESETEYTTRVVICSAPDQEYREIGFINGIFTQDGGTHVDAVSSELWKQLLPRFNKNSKTTVTARDLRPFFQVFVSAWAPNPEFSSQSKTMLLAPPIRFALEPRHVNSIMRWGFVEKIHELVRSREMMTLKKTEKKSRGFRRIEGLDPANLAGTKRWRECSLIVCEGLSAKTYAVKGISVGWNGKKGRDYFGVFALRGKPLNVRNATIRAISQNREITDVIQALGLRYNVDYTLEENMETLQYGRLIILTDADDDGHHIASLLCNFLHKLFPTLLYRNEDFLYYMMTPVAKIFGSPETRCFYNDSAYQKALAAMEGERFRVKYYKGLGTSSDAEIRDTFGQKVVALVRDDRADDLLNMVFHKALSNERKDWLGGFQPIDYATPEARYNISDFINQEHIQFSIEDCRRSIPSLYDGLKISQRKILYSVFRKRLSHGSKSMKVAQLAGYCAETSNYHHGEQCLYDTITRMAQDFPGSNNVPYLDKDGQFGSLSFGGKDAANARYIFTRCAPLTRLLFPEADDELLSYTLDDGDRVEPDYYVPILPTILGNGCVAGIGTGWSCSIPCHDFRGLAEATMERLRGGDPALDLSPSYTGFEGTIERLDANRFLSRGVLREAATRKKTARTYEITALPIGTWINRYKEELEAMMEAKKIRSLKNYSTSDRAHFVFEAAEDFTPTPENMGLVNTISRTNMVLFTDRSRLHKFKSLREIFDVFYEKRLGLYAERRKALMTRLEDRILLDKNRLRFLDEVDKGTLRVFRVAEADVVRALTDGGYHAVAPEDGYRYLLQTPLRDVSLEKMSALEKSIRGAEKELETLRATTPEAMWEGEIQAFLAAYQKIYPR